MLQLLSLTTARSSQDLTYFLPTAKATMVEKLRVKKYFPPASKIHSALSDNCT